MKRSRKVIFVSHCLINANAKAAGTSNHEAYYEGIVENLLHHEIGLIQAPCPELTYGTDRPPKNKEFYDTSAYRKHCREIVDELIETYRKYAENDYHILGFVGIEGSPTCGVSRTHVTVKRKSEKVTGKGVFIEELETRCREERIDLTTRDQDDMDELLEVFI